MRDRSCRGSVFKYEPLQKEPNQIRLLHVLPGDFEDPIQCELRKSKLVPIPKYETISYVWGDPEDRLTININGFEFSVPASSARAIRRVRLPDCTRVIWIDAICIDQSNLKERGRQVAMMGRIYAEGVQNLIYLGEEDFESAISSIREILKDAQEQDEDFILQTLRYEKYNWSEVSSSKNFIRVKYDGVAMRRLYQDEWFKYEW